MNNRKAKKIIPKVSKRSVKKAKKEMAVGNNTKIDAVTGRIPVPAEETRVEVQKPNRCVICEVITNQMYRGLYVCSDGCQEALKKKMK